MDTKTIVLSSARAIRHEQLQIEKSSLFLPNFITMSDFISKLCIVEEFKYLDEDSRVLLLLKASDFENFSKLQIQRNFFTFTKNSSYIFKFFEEISAERYNIENLDTSDIYAEYEEHIAILQELYKRYEKITQERKLLDKIFLPKLYKFNHSYAQYHQDIELHIDGHLTNFELELLQKCCAYTNISIVFKTSIFNKKMQEKFLKILDEELEVNSKYTISLNERKIINKEKILNNKNIICEPLSESILQIAFIKQKVYEFIDKGYQAQNIAVVLPDEKIASLLKSFDDKSNFNFAMGESFTSSHPYQKLVATLNLLEQNTKENYARLQRYGDEYYIDLLNVYHKKSSEVDIIELLEHFKESFTSKNELKIYEQELYSFKNVVTFMNEMKLKSLLSLFLQRLSKRTIDDVRGGKITVMGVLETRGIEFDGVVIIDFNDSHVPKRSDKDMFLNTNIRKQASLPTMGDRENLQKHYYHTLINSSKEVAISYVDSSDSNPSRFLKQLGIAQTTKYSELEYAHLLFHKKDTRKTKQDEIIHDYSFKDVKLSSTRLKTYLTCKRKYYYKYITHLNSHQIPKDMPKEHEIGVSIHLALKELYTKQNTYNDVESLQKDLYKELDKARGESELDKYLINLQKKHLKQFCINEIQRFKDGWSVRYCEENLITQYSGMTLVGQIDRIDTHSDGRIEVLDYKTGSYLLYNKNNYTDAKDFQLEFYYLLAREIGEVTQCSYYDLKENKIVNEPFLNEKTALLQSHIKDLLCIENVNFSKCEDTKNCLFCEYSTICHRD